MSAIQTTPRDEATVPKVAARMLNVTPTLARKWLQKNTHNRSVMGTRVEQYAADMRAGNWHMNGEAIKLAVDGTVLDGQHRLMAVVEAETPVQLLVISGLPLEAQETMDQGRSRTLANVLELRGEKYYRPLATSATALYLYESHGIPVKPPYAASPTVAQVSKTLERNPELRDSVAFTFGLTFKKPWLPTSHLGALHYLFACVDREAADVFITRLANGEQLERGDGICELRETLIQARLDRAMPPQRHQLALIIKGWNAWMTGTPVTRIEWKPGGARAEPFPAIHGLEPVREGTAASSGGGA